MRVRQSPDCNGPFRAYRLCRNGAKGTSTAFRECKSVLSPLTARHVYNLGTPSKGLVKTRDSGCNARERFEMGLALHIYPSGEFQRAGPQISRQQYLQLRILHMELLVLQQDIARCQLPCPKKQLRHMLDGMFKKKPC